MFLHKYTAIQLTATFISDSLICPKLPRVAEDRNNRSFIIAFPSLSSTWEQVQFTCSDSAHTISFALWKFKVSSLGSRMSTHKIVTIKTYAL